MYPFNDKCSPKKKNEKIAENTGSKDIMSPVCSGVVCRCATGCITNPKALQNNASPKVAHHCAVVLGNKEDLKIKLAIQA